MLKTTFHGKKNQFEKEIKDWSEMLHFYGVNLMNSEHLNVKKTAHL